MKRGAKPAGGTLDYLLDCSSAIQNLAPLLFAGQLAQVRMMHGMGFGLVPTRNLSHELRICFCSFSNEEKICRDSGVFNCPPKPLELLMCSFAVAAQNNMPLSRTRVAFAFFRRMSNWRLGRAELAVCGFHSEEQYIAALSDAYAA